MPSQYWCRHCTLDVEVGWHHLFFGSSDKPWIAVSAAVCLQCGTNHSQWHAGPPGDIFDVRCALHIEPSGPEKLKVMRLLRKAIPLSIHEVKARVATATVVHESEVRDLEKLHQQLVEVGAKATMEIVERTLVATVPAKVDRFSVHPDGPSFFPAGPVITEHNHFEQEFREIQPSSRTGDRGRFRIAEQTCGHCGHHGLCEYLEAEKLPCPHCKSPDTLEYIDGYFT